METQNLLGGAWLLARYDLELVMPLAVHSRIGGRRTTVQLADGTQSETFVEAMRPSADLRGHLTLHLKHEVLHLELLWRLYAQVDAGELVRWVELCHRGRGQSSRSHPALCRCAGAAHRTGGLATRRGRVGAAAVRDSGPAHHAAALRHPPVAGVCGCGAPLPRAGALRGPAGRRGTGHARRAQRLLAAHPGPVGAVAQCRAGFWFCLYPPAGRWQRARA